MSRGAPRAKRDDALIEIRATCRSRNASDLKVVALAVREGERVAAGQLLATLEYYKIATEITAPVAGAIARIHVRLDDEVQVGDCLVELRPG
jgi:pyruvate/2-oxoglutarate dehydrogenase complex dihydrolipoamide acyltransferase (E2) component